MQMFVDIAIVGVIAAAAIGVIFARKKKGGCHGSCSGCGGSCHH